MFYCLFYFLLLSKTALQSMMREAQFRVWLFIPKKLTFFAGCLRARHTYIRGRRDTYIARRDEIRK